MMDSVDFCNRVIQESGVLEPPKVVQYGYQLSPHITVGIDNVWSSDTHELMALPSLVGLFEEGRRLLGRAIRLNALYRTVKHQEDLVNAGYHAAEFASAHNCGAAFDAQDARDHSVAANVRLREVFRQAAQNLGLPEPRLGFTVYEEKLTHVDLWFMLFEPYTSLPHPSTWEDLDESTRNKLLAIRPGVTW